MATSFAVSRKFEEAALGSRQFGWIEAFIIVQNCSSAILFIPGTQPIRMFVRAAPYLFSLFLLFYYNAKNNRIFDVLRKRSLPGSIPLIFTLILLIVNLLHPTTDLPSGVAQCIFQICIAAPLFWADQAVRDKHRLERILWLIFLTSAVSAVFGLLQVYYPGIFMPPEFNSQALAINPDLIESLTYTGANGQEIIRPLGLTDQPGGAAVSGMIASVLGIFLCVKANQSVYRRIFYLLIAVISMVTLYLTQVRSLLLVMLIAICLICALLLLNRQFFQSLKIIGIALGLVIGGFIWAFAVGGESVWERFLGLTENGLIESFQQNRGIFLDYTLKSLLYEYPFGAGVGRWGIMALYFGGSDLKNIPPLYAEIQLTGWLYDGGVLMWLAYGMAIVMAMLYIYRIATSSENYSFFYDAGIIFCLNFIVVGMSFAGPIFNTQLGMQFWLLTAALYGAVKANQQNNPYLGRRILRK